MCDFISWIELTKNGKTGVLFLTDAEVYDDPLGKEKLRLCQHNDLIGHGAIRAYYGLMVHEGKEHEQRHFWNATLPPIIAEKIADFDLHWGRMFSNGVFQLNDLRWLICNAPARFKTKAWKQFLKQGPSREDLRDVVLWCATTRFKTKAWKKLLELKSSPKVLRDIVCDAPAVFRAKAWEKLLKQRPSIEVLRDIVCNAPAPYKARAWRLLLERRQPNIDLCHIVCNGPVSYRSKAWELLLKQGPSRSDLNLVARYRTGKILTGALAELAQLNAKLTTR